MANVSRINGLRPIKYLNGSAFNGAATLYFIPSGNAVATFVGDLVKLDTTGDPSGSGGQNKGIRSVVQAAAGDAAVGVVVAFAIDPTNLNTPQFRTASTGRYAYVVDDPNVLFEIQSNGTPTYGDVGLNASVVVGTGSATTGASAFQLDASTLAVTATLTLKVMEFTQRVDNEIGAVASEKVVVKINNHQLGSSTGTAGV